MKPTDQSHLPASERINWPTEYEPSRTSWYVHNEIEIEAPPEVVWAIIMEAETWPDWYEGASEVKILNSEEGVLKADSRFSWRTMGLDMVTEVKEFEPPYRLGWDTRRAGLNAYHAWLLVRTETGCRLITDESQTGWLTLAQKVFRPQALRKLHDIWLAEIKLKAEAKVEAGNTTSKR